MMKKNPKRMVLLLISLAFLVLLIYFSRVVLLPLILALIFSYLLQPIINFLEKAKIPVGWGVLLIYGMILGVVALALYWGMPRLVRELMAISQELPKYLEAARQVVLGWWQQAQTMFGFDELSPGLASGLDNILQGIKSDLANWVGNSLRVLPSFFSNLSILIFTPVIAFYLLRDRKDFGKRLKALLPPDVRERLLPLSAELDRVLRNFVKGYFLVAIIVGFVFYISLLVLGIDYALTLGIVMAVAELIPYFGPFLAFIPSVLLVLLQGPAAVAKLIVAWLIVQQLENLVISPKIMSNSVYLHPLLVMIVVLVGGYWFGVLGMILAVPVAAIIKVIVCWLYKAILLKQRDNSNVKL